MVDRLAATRFLAVLGPSGSGKSSLVRTGLFDALELGLHPAGSRWTVADLHPGREPLRNLAAALLATKGSLPAALDVDLLTIFLANGPRSVTEWASGGNLAVGTNLLILVDQFEELFRYGDYAQREEAEAFVALLLETAATAGIAIHVVITMRSEYLGACTLIPGLAERVNQGLYLTPRMRREECREAIEGPARVLGFKVAPDLVNRLLNDLASFAPWESGPSRSQLEELSRRADQLPLMQHVLNRLWVRVLRDAGGANVALTLSDYEQIGGLSGALDAHGEEILATLSREQAQRVEGIFRALISGPSVALAVRRPCRLGELVELAGGAREEILPVLAAFSAPDCNFIRTSGSSLTDDVIVDLSHESLIRQWSPLTRWLEKEIRDDREWRRLVEAQERHAEGAGDLLTGLDLQNQQAWWSSANPTPQWAARHEGNFESARDFLEKSRRAAGERAEAQRRREAGERQRLRAGVLALATALVIVAGLGIVIWVEARQASENAKVPVEILGKVSDTLFSDRYRSLIGMDQLQLELMPQLVQYLDGQLSRVVKPADFVQHKYRLAITYELGGHAPEAIKAYREAFTAGVHAITSAPAGQALTTSLEKNVVSDGVNYAWYLLDVGNRAEARDAISTMQKIASRHEADSALPVGLALAFGDLENLESRVETDLKQKDKADQHILRAIGIVRKATALDKEIEPLDKLVTLYGNLSQDIAKKLHIEVTKNLCDLAGQIRAKSPMDRRAVRAEVQCLRRKAEDASDRQAFAEAQTNLQKALVTNDTVLQWGREDQAALLSDAKIENSLADLALEQGQQNEIAQHYMQASNYFVRALRSRTLLQGSTDQVKSLYGSFGEISNLSASPFKGIDEELAFYKKIAVAVEKTRSAFPQAQSFAYVAADSAWHIGALLTKEKKYADAKTYLSRSIESFQISGAVSDTSIFSEEFVAYCRAYEQRVDLYAAMGPAESEAMIADAKRMSEVCQPILDKYPWDFYLRGTLMRSARTAGLTLFKAEKYREALPHMEYASHWGDKDISKLLAQAYRGGLGVPRNESKARELEGLAERQWQGFERFTIPAQFNGFKAPFYVYVREWPEDYPFNGIDDQIKWLQEARGGTLPPEVGESFRKLQQIARENHKSFPWLCVYALGSASKKPGA